ncbi:aminotransferase class IV [Bacillus cytotoxicus]
MLIYVNGTYVEDTEAKISPYDHGYLYGLGVFETFRIYNGHPFLLDDHYERLMDALLRSANRMGYEERRYAYYP